MSRASLFAIILAAAAPAAFGLQLAQQRVSQDAMTNTREAGWGNHQAWMKSMANLDKFRARLTEAWQGMGMSPQAAKMLADAYDPERAARLPHAALRGKSDQEIAQMLQGALKDKQFLHADQLLIDYLTLKAESAK